VYPLFFIDQIEYPPPPRTPYLWWYSYNYIFCPWNTWRICAKPGGVYIHCGWLCTNPVKYFMLLRGVPLICNGDFRILCLNIQDYDIQVWELIYNSSVGTGYYGTTVRSNTPRLDTLQKVTNERTRRQIVTIFLCLRRWTQGRNSQICFWCSIVQTFKKKIELHTGWVGKKY